MYDTSLTAADNFQDINWWSGASEEWIYWKGKFNIGSEEPVLKNTDDKIDSEIIRKLQEDNLSCMMVKEWITKLVKGML